MWSQLTSSHLALQNNRVDTLGEQPLFIKGSCVERVLDLKFLGVYIEEHLISVVHATAEISKIGLRLYFLRILRNNHIDQKLLLTVATESTS